MRVMNRYLLECSEKLCFLSLRSLFRVCYEITSALCESLAMIGEEFRFSRWQFVDNMIFSERFYHCNLYSIAVISTKILDKVGMLCRVIQLGAI
jgi:hypothetical protein